MDYLNNMFSLKGNIALVTGGSYGIGFAIAKALARAGAVIAFNCRSQEHLDQAMKDYKREGIDAHGYICDVTDEIHVQQLVSEIEKTLGTIDILVNNAGIIKRIPMCDMTTEEFRQVVDIDLVGPFIVSKAVIPGMIKKGHGKIINICSMMSELGRETVSAYAAAKGGLKMLTRNICAEFGVAIYPVQRHWPWLYRNASDSSATRKATRRIPPSFRPVHRLQDASWPLGHNRRPRRASCILSFPCVGLRQCPHLIRRRRHSCLYRKATVNEKDTGP